MQRPVIEQIEEFEIYDGRRRLGSVDVQAPQWVAANDDNEIIGRYQSRKAAIDAIRNSTGRVR